MSATELPATLTVRDVSTILQLTPQMILKLIAGGQLEAERVGVKYIIQRQALLRYLEACRVWR